MVGWGEVPDFPEGKVVLLGTVPESAAAPYQHHKETSDKSQPQQHLFGPQSTKLQFLLPGSS